MIACCDVLDYAVREGPFAGEPTILQQVEEQEYGAQRSLLRIDTTAGYRTLRCAAVELRPYLTTS